MFGPELAGPRLTLRPPTIRDIPHFRRWLGDPEVNRYWWTREVPWAKRPMAAALVLFVGGLRPSVMLWTIEHERRPIGLSVVRHIDRRKARATVAVIIGERSEQRKGFAVEAATIRNGFVFDRLGLTTVRATARSENLASRRLLERSGYQLIDTPRTVGGNRDLVVYELTRSDYDRKRLS